MRRNRLAAHYRRAPNFLNSPAFPKKRKKVEVRLTLKKQASARGVEKKRGILGGGPLWKNGFVVYSPLVRVTRASALEQREAFIAPLIFDNLDCFYMKHKIKF